MLLPPVVAGSSVASHPRQRESHGEHGPPSPSHAQQEASSAVSEGAAVPFLRHVSLTGKYSENEPLLASRLRPQLNTEQQEVSFPMLRGKQQVASVTIEAAQATPSSFVFPTHSPYHHHFLPPYLHGGPASRVAYPVTHTPAVQHPLGDPSRSDFLIRKPQAAASDRRNIPSSDSNFRFAAKTPSWTEGMRERISPSVERATSMMASSRLGAATSAHMHKLGDLDPPQMEHGFGGDLLGSEPEQQNDGKKEPSVNTIPPAPAQKSSGPSAPQDAADISSHSMDQQHIDSLLRSLFSSPALLLLGVVFAASAAYMAIVMDEQAAQQRLQQAQLAAAFGVQPFSEGRRKRGLATQPISLIVVLEPNGAAS